MTDRERLIKLLDDVIYNSLPKHNKGEKVIDDIADYLLSNGVTMQEWISVKDRLPNWRDGKVLVFTKYGFSICERTVNNRWQGQHANWITHWAYLPQPPKGE